MSFAEQSLRTFVEALAKAEPTPGGGTASAVAGAIGTALLMMVAGLPRKRGGTDERRSQLAEAQVALQPIRDRLLTLADQDSAAYDGVLASYRLSKGTAEEQAARREAIQRSSRAATEAPLETLRAAATAVTHAQVIALHGNPSAASDVRVALELLEAAAAGAAANVEANLPSLDDAAYKKATASALVDVSNTLTEQIAAARASLNRAPGGDAHR